jgi:hypothetical protein
MVGLDFSITVIAHIVQIRKNFSNVLVIWFLIVYGQIEMIRFAIPKASFIHFANSSLLVYFKDFSLMAFKFSFYQVLWVLVNYKRILFIGLDWGFAFWALRSGTQLCFCSDFVILKLSF